MVNVEPTGQACGAVVTGVDLTKPMDAQTIAQVRKAWLEHHVVVFPEQKLQSEDLVRFVESFGPIGDDPFFNPIDGHDRIAAIWRKADEEGRLFADNWHSDWSFQVTPPSGSCLYGIIIPPVGGNTLFSNQHKALDEMPADLRARIEGVNGLHSAAGAYANDGAYARDKYQGAMSIRTSDDAKAIHAHPLIRNHPETGRPGLFCGSYVFDLQGMPQDDAEALIAEIAAWQDRPEFIYRHVWQPDMLIMWDNRSVLHRVTGGFEGHERLLHRLTVADDKRFHLAA